VLQHYQLHPEASILVKKEGGKKPPSLSSDE
jgi:hypothetical protein